MRRVLRSDGTLWLNIGDSYATQNAVGNRTLTGRKPGQALNCFREGYIPPYHAADNVTTGIKRSIPSGLKPKDLMGIPWTVALALRQDGWWLRSDIIWNKLNCMPSSVEDRPTQAHEYIFLLTKSERYFYDHVAVKEPVVRAGRSSGNKARKIADGTERSRLDTHMGSSVPWTDNGTGRNKRTVWTINTKPYRGAHFAVFPPALIEPCILAGTSEQGCCSKCGSPLERVFERVVGISKECPKTQASHIACGEVGIPVGTIGKSGSGRTDGYTRTIGWKPTCDCERSVKEPCVVLDPFAGSGTVGEVAKSFGRNSVLIELNPAYVELIKQRVGEGVEIVQ